MKNTASYKRRCSIAPTPELSFQAAVVFAKSAGRFPVEANVGACGLSITGQSNKSSY